ncbi:MAG: hypothetical protein FWD72_00455, partial [Eggerthellaceae bacterium]|nr:hypothetical protein [Eggerthellaceae bacterium]
LVTLTSSGTINLIEVKWLGKTIDLTSLPFTPGVVTSENVVSTPDDTATTDISGDTTDTTDNTDSVA